MVTTSNDDGSKFEATAFEVGSNRAIRQLVAANASWSAPTSALVGDMHYAVASGVLVATDLSTGAVRRASLCPKANFAGNPMPSPAGDLLLVTCDADGLAIDPRTLATKRRYTKIMPGCDNGDFLPRASTTKSEACSSSRGAAERPGSSSRRASIDAPTTHTSSAPLTRWEDPRWGS